MANRDGKNDAAGGRWTGLGVNRAGKAADDDVWTGAGTGKPIGRLTVIDGPGRGQSVPIPAASCFIGRDQTNHVALGFGDDTIHRKKHAEISLGTDGFRLRSLAGGNPISVNGHKVRSECQVHFGDRIVIGETTLRLDPP